MKNYIIQTHRLGLRSWLNSDRVPFAEMNSNALVMEHFPKQLNLQESNELFDTLLSHFEKFGFTYFAVDELASDKFIGFIGMKHQTYKADFTPAIDIGWRLAPAFWGKGYATEGAQACLDEAFPRFGIKEIVSVCTHKNRASEKVMQKLGMHKVYEFDHPALEVSAHLNPCFLYRISFN